MSDSDDVILVKVNGKIYETIIDDKGIQRFKRNKVLCRAFDMRFLDMTKVQADHDINPECYDLDDYIQLWAMLGVAVDTFATRTAFKGVVIKNPIMGDSLDD